MHNLPIYQVDAFADKVFSGNPAAVVPVPEFPSDELMQNIATENNLSETAFVTINGPGKFNIRWFTPAMEVRLCGHATLAAAHILYKSGGETLNKMRFKTREAGTIVVVPNDDGSYSMDFPVDKPEKIRSPKGLRGILGGIKPLEVYAGIDDLIVVLKNQSQVEKLNPNFPMLAALKKRRGLLVTAPGKKHDFVSRCFFPAYGIDEDPVTGSAHTVLTPLWAGKLGKKKLKARQISTRGGDIDCQLRGKKVRLTGQAITYMTGQIVLQPKA
ncbi:PhzF family phenazine biosynthesis protein [Neolewinella aurantiaca]|uniref:PhzF family phenazine biosynthesis protein n=1 Tax=Neolewinella aurantiaca TaxID=2602767 RepID=A0A5C7FH71_9BACT|nr:PhzF family phenazine biosynthesis protein [Neolewinella aurantiaca]TXF89776.1 PhzF family phenazine biosynthesis protein [Neolewinella aurantiaca]